MEGSKLIWSIVVWYSVQTCSIPPPPAAKILREIMQTTSSDQIYFCADRSHSFLFTSRIMSMSGTLGAFSPS